MSNVLTMDEAVTERLLDNTAQGLIGRPVDRPDGPYKVSGTATYANEWSAVDKAHGVLVGAPIAKGQVIGIDRAEIEALPGILGVFSDARFLRNPAQGTANAAPEQGVTEIVYVGQPVALVVADSFERARHGARQLRIRCEVDTSAVFDPEAADREPEAPESKQSSQGDLDQAMQEAAFSIDQTYRTPGHNSAAMEPHAAIASWEGESLLLQGSLQMLKYNINELADALGIEPGQVRIHAPYVGGGFGSKLGISPEAVAAAIAAKELGRPVSVAMTRPQVFEAVVRRSETRQRLRLAADAEGVLSGIGHENLVSNLVDEAFAEPVAQATPFLYRGAHRRIGMQIARVNRTLAGSVRAPGEAVGLPVLENAMDELADAMGIDPVELRKRNIPETHPVSGKPYGSRKLAEALDEGARLFGWDKRHARSAVQREGDWYIGMGMASAARVNLLMESKARVILHADATATVETDMTDIGTGTYAILTQLAGELLGLPMHAVTTVLGDSDLPTAAGSGGSWGAASSGSSVLLACEDLRERLCKRLDCRPDDLTLKDGAAYVLNRRTALAEVLGGQSLSAEGHLKPGKTLEDVQQATYGAHFAEVAVNATTGETRVRRMLGGVCRRAHPEREDGSVAMLWRHDLRDRHGPDRGADARSA